MENRFGHEVRHVSETSACYSRKNAYSDALLLCSYQKFDHLVRAVHNELWKSVSATKNPRVSLRFLHMLIQQGCTNTSFSSDGGSVYALKCYSKSCIKNSCCFVKYPDGLFISFLKMEAVHPHETLLSTYKSTLCYNIEQKTSTLLLLSEP